MKAIQKLLTKQSLRIYRVGEVSPEIISKYTGIKPKHLTDDIIQEFAHRDITDALTHIGMRKAVAEKIKRERFAKRLNNQFNQTGKAMKKIAPYAGIGIGVGGLAMTEG